MGHQAWSGQGRGTSGAKVAKASAGLPLARLAMRAAVSVALTIGFVWLLAERWSQIDMATLAQTVARLHPRQWALALAFTAASFWAVGRYDAVLHRHFATGIPDRAARRAGVCAIAVSQTLGLGLISGAIVRWRLLPGVSLWQATRLTAAVALSFLAGWAVVTAATLVLLPQAPYRGWAALGLGLAFGLAALSIFGPRLPELRLPGVRPVGLRFRWPNSFTLTRLIGLCATDTLAAALAFHALLPAETALPFTTLLPAFLLALGAGLSLGTPGGMGAFELSLLALLPQAPEAGLLAGVLAWRLVYYAVPAALGAALALRGADGVATLPRSGPRGPDLWRAEAGLCRQGNLAPAMVAGQPWILGRQGHCLTALLDPMGEQTAVALDAAVGDLAHMAHAEARLSVIYKASARLAVRARACGYALRRIGFEAWITPQDYRLSASCRSGLRRKLRRAEAAGVTVRACPGFATPWAALDRIAAAWAAAHGGERGFSMGRHGRDHLSHQRLYIAWAADRPIAYASFHTAPGEWVLDLMRHEDGVPDGTMHSLVQAAITDASLAGVPQLSLAAVPAGAFGCHDLASRLIAALAPETAAPGLLQFKSSFAPRWSALYLAAPSRLGLVLAGLSLARAITRPPPIMPEIERDDAEYGFASGPDPWHIAKNRR
jgi:phosphatidylglycerol lysyltransferase